MIAGAEDGRRLEVELDESIARLVLDTLGVFIGVTEESLDHADGEGRELLEARLNRAREMREGATATGPVRLVGDEGFVVDVVRAVASHAAYQLDVLLEGLAGKGEQLGDPALDAIRGANAVASTAVDALITCEANRRAS